MTPGHKANLTKNMTAFLDRRQPPKSISSNDKLKVDQIAAYIDILLSHAPVGDALHTWWQKFIKDLGMRIASWGWPTEAEVGLSAKEASKDGGHKKSAWETDSLTIAISRMAKGEPICEKWLWGSNAVKLIERIGLEPIQQRRDQFAGEVARRYGIERAREMITEREITHEKAVREAKEEHHSCKVVEAKLIIRSVRELLDPTYKCVPNPGVAE